MGEDVTIVVKPQFALCEESEGESSFYMFPNKFDFVFYNAFCENLGGLMPIPFRWGPAALSAVISKTLGSDENYHELMDVVGSLINPEIREKCMHSTGDVIIWLGT